MKNTVDYKSRFRILKGGRISLVVSALLVSRALVTPAHSAVITVDTALTTYQFLASPDSMVITNTGSIIGDTTQAVYLSTSITNASYLDNSGTISYTGSDNSHPKYAIKSHSEYGTITNNAVGTISAINTGDARGIYFAYRMKVGSSVVNSGTIEANSTIGNASGIHIHQNMYGTITNSAGGTISAMSEDGGANGVQFSYGMETDSSLINSGTISATSTTANAFGIDVANYYMNGTITNNTAGTISATSTDGNATGINFGYGMEIGSSFVNNGTISATSTTANAYGIRGRNYVMDGNITNNGTITATINGVAEMNAFSLDVASGTYAVTNTSSGTLNGNILVGGTLSNSGLISLPHNANGANSAFVNNFVQTATGTLEIGLLTDGTTTTNSQLSTTNASFEAGSTIAVDVLAASTNQNLLIGQTLTNVVTANTNLTIGGALNITDNSALLNFEYSTSLSTDVNAAFINGEDGAIHLTAVEGTSILDSTIAGSGNTNALAVATALQSISDASYPDMDSFFTALNGLGTDEEVAEAVKTLAPQSALAVAGAASQISSGIQGIVQMRQNSNVGGGLNSGEELFGEKNIWFKVYGSFGSQDDKDGINGFDVNTAGLGFGIDGEYASNQRIGLGLFYTKANVDVNNLSQSSNMDVFSTIVYGNIPFLDNKTNFMYQLGYALQQTDSTRYIALTSQTATADYTTNTASVDLKVVRDYEVNSNLLLQPVIEATYRNFDSPDYSETGAGTLNLTSNSFSSDEFILGVGTLANYKLDDDSMLIANVNVGYDVNNEQQTVTSSFQGASGVKFDTDGIDNGRFNYDLGVGYERDVKVGHSLNFSYNYQGQGSTSENHALSVKYVFSF